MGFKDQETYANQPAEHTQSRVNYAIPVQIGMICPAAWVVVANRQIESPPSCLRLNGGSITLSFRLITAE